MRACHPDAGENRPGDRTSAEAVDGVDGDCLHFTHGRRSSHLHERCSGDVKVPLRPEALRRDDIGGVSLTPEFETSPLLLAIQSLDSPPWPYQNASYVKVMRRTSVGPIMDVQKAGGTWNV